MFTGLIEEMGIVSLAIRDSNSLKLTVAAKKVLEGLKPGDSVAIDGACLTVIAVDRNSFKIDVSPETLSCTTLPLLKIGDNVNLERALLVNGRINGHLMSGHVDGVGIIRDKLQVKVKDGTTFMLEVEIPRSLRRYLIDKGSIAVDGVSLTIINVKHDSVALSIIPHTAKFTTFNLKNIGDKVNIEVDMLSKYIEKHLRGEPPTITEQVLVDSGFIPLGIMDN